MLFLDFFRKKEKTGEISVNWCSFFAFSLSSLGFLTYFLGVFCLFSLIFERSRCCLAYFLRLFLFFWRNYRLFYLFFLFLRLLIFCRATKKRQFLSKIMMKKQNIMENCSCFFVFCFLLGLFLHEFLRFLRKSRVKNTNTAIFTKHFSASIAKISLKNSG